MIQNPKIVKLDDFVRTFAPAVSAPKSRSRRLHDAGCLRAQSIDIAMRIPVFLVVAEDANRCTDNYGTIDPGRYEALGSRSFRILDTFTDALNKSSFVVHSKTKIIPRR